mmetsp:Transcript_4417/g.5449  ORF Transcript_4417/g.5449 Transcript_4417/m.5449 type:complete len:98 (+) Transcript_4417:363-656(+)
MKVSPAFNSIGSEGTSKDKETYLMDEHGDESTISLSSNTEWLSTQTHEEPQLNNTQSSDNNPSLQTIQKQDKMFYKKPKKGMLMRVKEKILTHKQNR